MRVAVAGGGVLGAALAFSLARLGAAVSVVAEHPGGIATPGSFAWINAASPVERAYSDLRMASIALWRGLEGLPVRLAGGLSWDISAAGPEAGRAAARADFAARGYPVREVGAAEIRALEPMLGAVPEHAFLAEAEGVADPDTIAAAFLARSGAELVTARVAAVETAGGRATGLRLTGGGSIAADAVVLAAGAGTPALLAPLGAALPVTAVPGLILRTAPLPPLTRRVICAPELHLWQRDDGVVLAAEDYAGSDPAEADALMATLAARIAALFPGAGPVRAAGHTLAARPMPEDDRPFAGPVPGIPGLHVCVSHSGVTLAPILGDLMAGEITGGAPAPMLAPFRPGRAARPAPEPGTVKEN